MVSFSWKIMCWMKLLALHRLHLIYLLIFFVAHNSIIHIFLGFLGFHCFAE